MDSQDCINISPDRSRDWGSSIIPDLDKISSAELVCRGMRKRSNKRERERERERELCSRIYNVPFATMAVVNFITMSIFPPLYANGSGFVLLLEQNANSPGTAS